MQRHLFDEVEDVVRGMAPEGLGELQVTSRRWGIKVWFGSPSPQRVHYEAQLIRRAHFDDGEGWALEIGFHAEHKDEARNEAELAGLMECEGEWMSKLGGDPEAGPFLGNPQWRRVSEVWLDPEMDDPGTGFEIGSRLVDYLDALEPCRHPTT
ncbi:MAG: hypothetical protein ACN4GZ_15375 [Acidimicrobiales bacterium]